MKEKEVGKMKKKYRLMFVMTLVLVLAACGNNAKDVNEGKVIEKPVAEDNVNPTQNGTDTTGESANPNNTGNEPANEVNQDEMLKKMDELDYVDFDLSVEYADQREYEAEIEKNSNNSIEAKIEDDLNNINKVGSDAFNELYPLVKKLTITGETSKEDAIKEILATFNLPADYQEFDLDIKFKDGPKLEFEDKK